MFIPAPLGCVPYGSFMSQAMKEKLIKLYAFQLIILLNVWIYFIWWKKLRLSKWYQNGLNIDTFGGHDLSDIILIKSKELRWNCSVSTKMKKGLGIVKTCLLVKWLYLLRNYSIWNWKRMDYIIISSEKKKVKK